MSRGFLATFVSISIIFNWARAEIAEYHLRHEIQWTEYQQEMIDHDLRCIAQLKKQLREANNG